jgi:hypothetical protein
MPWCYTIGLTETFGHPELVMVEMKMAAEEELIRWAVGQIESDGSLAQAELAREGVKVVTVHDCHPEGGEWFGTWTNPLGRLASGGLISAGTHDENCATVRLVLERGNSLTRRGRFQEPRGEVRTQRSKDVNNSELFTCCPQPDTRNSHGCPSSAPQGPINSVGPSADCGVTHGKDGRCPSLEASGTAPV